MQKKAVPQTPPLVAPPALAPEFITGLCDNASQTLLTWLRANDAPCAVRALADLIPVLERYSLTARLAGSVSASDNATILENVQVVVNAAAQLGAAWHSADSMVPGRKPIAWRPRRGNRG